MSSTEKSTTVVGAQVIKVPTISEPALTPPPRAENPFESSPAPSSVSLVPEAEFDPCQHAKPYSPFYRHTTTRTSLEQLNSQTKMNTRGQSQDLERGMNGMKTSMDCRRGSLWAQKKRKCDFLSALPKRQKTAVKILIAIFIVGVMVAIGLGISKAVGGGVWKSSGQSQEIH